MLPSECAEQLRVCIDLGTSLSKASLFLGGHRPACETVAPLPIGAAAGAEHSLLTPSAMFVDGERIYFGPAALERARESGDAKRLPILSFKMILAARELEPTLALKLSRLIDPSGTFCHRDALVLYLAYLDQLVRAAVATESTLPAAAADAPRRITSPQWRGHGTAAPTIGRMVEEAVTVSAQLGADLLGAQGVALTRTKDALERGAAVPSRGHFEGIVFEAHCAASAYAAFSSSRARFFLVIDMGAGTTDVAGFERANAAHTSLVEITEARQWCTLAGDELDGIVIDLFVRAAGKREREDEARLWRGLRLSTLRLKRDLFLKGKASFEHRRKRISIRREVLMRDASFRDLCHALTKTFAMALAPLAAKAQQAGATSVTILLAGGGSGMPFVADLARNAAARAARGLKLEIEPFGANWSLPYGHHPLDGAFPQMAISMGGALAPLGERAALAYAAA